MGARSGGWRGKGMGQELAIAVEGGGAAGRPDKTAGRRGRLSGRGGWEGEGMLGRNQAEWGTCSEGKGMLGRDLREQGGCWGGGGCLDGA